jgi:hypothetical protein
VGGGREWEDGQKGVQLLRNVIMRSNGRAVVMTGGKYHGD